MNNLFRYIVLSLSLFYIGEVYSSDNNIENYGCLNVNPVEFNKEVERPKPPLNQRVFDWNENTDNKEQQDIIVENYLRRSCSMENMFF